jgi:ElaB/YqjD/DUF883 family membrane-anchored ribosome-binding protein
MRIMETMTPTRTGKWTESQSQSSECGCSEKETSLANEAVHKAKEMTKEASSAVADKAHQAAAATGRGFEYMAEGIRDHTPDSGILGTASNKLADSLECSGKYLEEHGMSAMCQDLTGVIRANPITSLAVAAGIGFLVARAAVGRSA